MVLTILCCFGIFLSGFLFSRVLASPAPRRYQRDRRVALLLATLVPLSLFIIAILMIGGF